jgi:glycosyltransferase involved in cell wall biosynthesis
MISIVVPAHNESSVIARTLGAWVEALGAGEIEVVVVCNGCEDNTADIARLFLPPARVIESGIASKTHALNLGDQEVRAFPRVYVDADVLISVDAIRVLTRQLEGGGVLAVAPTPDINLTDCSWFVRKYYGIRSRLPSARDGIGGSGVYALSEEGRKRFTQFPNIIADDIFVRLQFTTEERQTLPSVRSMVFPPRTVLQLAAVRTRAYTGLSQIAYCYPELSANKGKTNNRVLLALFKEPRLWLGLLVYCGVNIFARCRARIRRRAGVTVWQRDNTSRLGQPTGPSILNS